MVCMCVCVHVCTRAGDIEGSMLFLARREPALGTGGAKDCQLRRGQVARDTRPASVQ